MKWLKIPTFSSAVLEENENPLCKIYMSFNKAILWHRWFWQKADIGHAIEHFAELRERSAADKERL